MSDFKNRLRKALDSSGQVKYKKGGYIKDSGGGDQVVYGAGHNQGGVLRNSNVELEGGGYTPNGQAKAGEVITTIYDNGGNPQEFYMSHKNGIAQRYLQAKAENGGTLPQQTKQEFAKLNESMNPDGSPLDIAANGGMSKEYGSGGKRGFWDNVHAKRKRGEAPDKSKVSADTAKRFNLENGGMNEYGMGGNNPYMENGGYKTHDMTNPKTGYTISATNEGAHNSLKGAGFTHAYGGMKEYGTGGANLGMGALEDLSYMEDGGMKKYFMGGMPSQEINAAQAGRISESELLHQQTVRADGGYRGRMPEEYYTGGFPAVTSSYLPSVPGTTLPSIPNRLPMSGRGIPGNPFGSGSGIPQRWAPRPTTNPTASSWSVPNWMKRAGTFATAMLDTEGFEAGAVRGDNNSVISQGEDMVGNNARGGQITTNYFNGRVQKQDFSGKYGEKGSWYYPDEKFNDVDNSDILRVNDLAPTVEEQVEEVVTEEVVVEGVTPGDGGVNNGTDETRSVQNDLLDKGYGLPKYGADGKMGDETQGAIDGMNDDRARSAAGHGVNPEDLEWDPTRTENNYGTDKGGWMPKEGAVNTAFGDVWKDGEWAAEEDYYNEEGDIVPENQKAKTTPDDKEPKKNFLDRIGMNNITDAIEIASIMKANRYAQKQNKKIGELKVKSKKIQPGSYTPETVDLGDDKERTSQLTVANIKAGQESGKSMASIIAAQKAGQGSLRSIAKTESELQKKQNNIAKKMNMDAKFRADTANTTNDRNDQVANNDAKASMLKNSIALSQNMRNAISTKIKDTKQLKAAENQMLVINKAIAGGTGTDKRKGIDNIRQLMNKSYISTVEGEELIANIEATIEDKKG